MAYAVQQLINGVTLGMIYGLIAIGYTLVYGIIGLINFAHGDVFMLGAFLALLALVALAGAGVTAVPLALVLALVAAAAVAGLWGWAIERVAYRPLRGSFRLAPLISAIGLSIALENFVQIAQGPHVEAIAPLLPGALVLFRQHGFAVALTGSALAVILVTVAALLAVTALVTRTALGRAMRACEQDMGMAALLGIDTDRTVGLAFVLGAALAAVAGLLFLVRYGVIDFAIGFGAGVKAFTAAVLGGIGSLPGAVLGGLLIGLVETIWSAYGPAEYKDVAAYSILILVLIVRPAGLLGHPDTGKV